MAGNENSGHLRRLQPSVQKNFIHLVRQGNFTIAVCRALSIPRSVFYDAMARGKEGDPMWADFYERVNQAKGEAECNAVNKLVEHMDKDFRAVTWFLERAYPNRWAKKEHVDPRLRERFKNGYRIIVEQAPGVEPEAAKPDGE